MLSVFNSVCIVTCGVLVLSISTGVGRVGFCRVDGTDMEGTLAHLSGA